MNPADENEYVDKLIDPERKDSRPPLVGRVVDLGAKPNDAATGRHVYAFEIAAPSADEDEGAVVDLSSHEGVVYALDITPVESGGNPQVGDYLILWPQGDRYVFERGAGCKSIDLTIYGWGPGFDASLGDGSRFHVVIWQVKPGTPDDGRVLFDGHATDATPSGDVNMPRFFTTGGTEHAAMTIPHGLAVVGVVSVKPGTALDFRVEITDDDDPRFKMEGEDLGVPPPPVGPGLPDYGFPGDPVSFTCAGRTLIGPWCVGTVAVQLYDRLTCITPTDASFGALGPVAGATITLHTFDGDLDAGPRGPGITPRGVAVTTTDDTDAEGIAYPAFPYWVADALRAGDPVPGQPGAVGIWVDWSAPGYDPTTGTTRTGFLPSGSLPVAGRPRAFDPDGDGYAGKLTIGTCNLAAGRTRVDESDLYVSCMPRQVYVTILATATNQDVVIDPGTGDPMCDTADMSKYFWDVSGDFTLDLVGQFAVAVGAATVYYNLYLSACMDSDQLGKYRVVYSSTDSNSFQAGGVYLQTEQDADGNPVCPAITSSVNSEGKTVVALSGSAQIARVGASYPTLVGLVVVPGAPCATSGDLDLVVGTYFGTPGYPCDYAFGGAFYVFQHMKGGTWHL